MKPGWVSSVLAVLLLLPGVSQAGAGATRGGGSRVTGRSTPSRGLVGRSLTPVRARRAPAPRVAQAMSGKGRKGAGQRRKHTLPQLLAMALKASPRIAAARHRLAGMKARLSEARWLSWSPQGSLSAYVAPGPPARGNAVTSETPWPNSFFNISEYGFLARIQATAGMPIYTFGKLSSLRRAATAGVRVGRQNVRLKRHEVTLQVRKAYYALQLAHSSVELLEEAADHLAKAKKRVKRLIAADSSEVGKTDLFKLQVFEAELQGRMAKAKLGRRIARAALAALVGLPGGGRLELDSYELPDGGPGVLPLRRYLSAAVAARPELRLLHHTERAKRHLLTARRRALLPDLFVGAFFRWGVNTAADDQKSPFAKDDFNYIEAGLGLGIKVDLDFGIKAARARREAASLKRFRAQRRLARMGIRLQLRARYLALRSAIANIEIQRKGKKAASRWATRAVMAYESGLIKTKDLVDALVALAQRRFEHFRALHDAQVAAAELSRAVGMDLASVKRSAGGPGPRKARPAK